jgi:ankyrin repeat protein
MKKLTFILLLAVSISSQAQKKCKELLLAVNNENLTEVKELLKTINPNCSYSGFGEPRSPLVSAARNGNLSLAKILVSANANIEFHDSLDETPLMAASKYGHLSFVKYLISQKVRIDAVTDNNGTALIYAVKGNHYEIVKELLDNGANPLLNTYADESAIHHAITGKNKKIITLLNTYKNAPSKK